MNRVPYEVANTTAQMQEKCEGAAEQYDVAGPGADRFLSELIALGSLGGRA